LVVSPWHARVVPLGRIHVPRNETLAGHLVVGYPDVRLPLMPTLTPSPGAPFLKIRSLPGSKEE
jgi:hypothetical protein